MRHSTRFSAKRAYKLCFIAGLFSVFFYSLTTYAINTNENKSIIVTADNPQFTINLKSNPTTGYSWHVGQYDTNLLEVVSHKYNPSTSQLVGAGGIDVWTFKVTPTALTAPHVITLKMNYLRPWAPKENASEQEFTIFTTSKE